MYKIYVIKQRKGGSEVLLHTATHTHHFAVAQTAFWALYQEPFDHKHLLLMTKNGKQINAYRYQSQENERDYLPYGATLND